MIIVTGGAGFIGSNLVAALGAENSREIAVCDRLSSGEKWRNLCRHTVSEFIEPAELLDFVQSHRDQIEVIVHLGAISSTTETDAGRVIADNFVFSSRLWDWCVATGCRIIYASSAATYGDGSNGFDDDASIEHLTRLRPLNLYAWSKHLFDCRVSRRVAARAAPPQWVGLKFFNVYGPNEYHKGEMMSLVAKRFADVKAGKLIRLFKSHRDGIADGDQRRDFIYVDDAVAVVRWLMQTPSVSGIFNVGTGQARSFRELMLAMFAALGKTPNIEYIDMPVAIRDQYQYFTQASVENLRKAGYNAGFTPLGEAVNRYVSSYLDQPDRYR
jgi:ADP-L-glycero-D-manno-heptose 6-epimerase